MEVGLSPKWERSPQFSAHVYCGETAVCIPLGAVLGVNLGDIVLDCDPFIPGHSPQFPMGMGTQLPLSKRGRNPLNFRPISVVDKWLDGSRCHLV